ncbi:MAG: hypothetical protein WC308_00780 [archaeon]|jgi:hypothetical protein
MDYDGIIESTYRWVFQGKALVYLLFFFLIFLAVFFIQGVDAIFWGNLVVSENVFSIFNDVYYIAQAVIFVGIVFLLGFCLKSAGFQTVKISVSKILDVFFLQVFELWYIFVWSMSRRYRRIQILSLVGIFLAVITLSVVSSWVVVLSFIFLLAIYLSCIVYNSVRLLFSSLIILNRGTKIGDALRGSWSLTHQRFGGLFSAFCVLLVFLFFLCAVSSFFASTIANIVLLSVGFHSFFDGTTLSDLEFARIFGTAFGVSVFVVGYCFSVTRLYSQAVKHQDSSNKIRRILSWRVLYPRKIASKRFAKAARKSKAIKKRRK